ncbi:hypothetical protein PR202_gb23641 [Eleusine coracana subsp. coracana]|uniref:Uncharacterized protein n=1 Tax=Eleusine coracana subsp. coracana TaxID=191504 RepID=A0AAV5FKE9_ELECO|nr:hypothetical protein PR202_gb23641 [Eleusine coracana subsp. coracana]
MSPRFADVSGTDPRFFDLSLAFLPDQEREGLDLVDGCNGLLFRCYRCGQLAWGSIQLSPRISISLSFNWIGLRIAIVKIMTMMGMGMS